MNPRVIPSSSPASLGGVELVNLGFSGSALLDPFTATGGQALGADAALGARPSRVWWRVTVDYLVTWLMDDDDGASA